jgi:hypothetical protein
MAYSVIEFGVIVKNVTIIWDRIDDYTEIIRVNNIGCSISCAYNIDKVDNATYIKSFDPDAIDSANNKWMYKL